MVTNFKSKASKVYKMIYYGGSIGMLICDVKTIRLYEWEALNSHFELNKIPSWYPLSFLWLGFQWNNETFSLFFPYFFLGWWSILSNTLPKSCSFVHLCWTPCGILLLCPPSHYFCFGDLQYFVYFWTFMAFYASTWKFKWYDG